MKRISAAVLLGFVFSATGVNAATIDERQHKQSHRIVEGVTSGELNRKEARRLGHQQARVAKKEAYFKSDGEFTNKERAIIQKDLTKASHNIYKQKHDAQVRY